MATALAAAMMLGLMLATTACSGSVQDRQASADQVFGDAKMGLVVASGLVGIYNFMPVCSAESLPPPLCYSEPVAEIRPIERSAETLEERLARLEREGQISPAAVEPARGNWKPIAPRPGALQRFLDDRD